MHRAPNSVLAIDIQNNAILLSKDILAYLDLPPGSETYSNLIKKIYNLTRDMIDDIVTENLFWTKDDTVAEADRYTKTLPIRPGEEEEVRDLFETYIVEIEELVGDLNILPSWSFFEVMLKSQYILIHRFGDYRIEDWMKKNKRKGNKKTRLSR